VEHFRNKLKKTESSNKQLKERTKDLEDKIETTKLETERLERKKREEIISSQSEEDVEISDGSQVQKLKKEIENMKLEHHSEILKLQARHTNELKDLKQDKLLHETSSFEKEQHIVQLNENFEKFKKQTKIQTDQHYDDQHAKDVEIDALRKEMSELQASCKRDLDHMKKEKDSLYNENLHLKDKDKSVRDWEAQITEIIQWVTDEKDTRGYLQALATKMTDEIDILRQSSQRANSMDKWQTQRRQKVEKQQLLDLQQTLQSEVVEKQAIKDNLDKSTQQNEVLERRLDELEKSLERVQKESQEFQTENEKLRAKIEMLEKEQLEHFVKISTPLSLRSRISSIKSRKGTGSMNSEPKSPTPTAHQFVMKTFSVPKKCHLCGSLMVGLVRQGVSCSECPFECHVACAQSAPAVCPLPPDDLNKICYGINQETGTGTLYENYIKVPKPMGVKKGWVKQLAVICDFKIFLYDMGESGSVGRLGNHNNHREAQPSVIANHVIDMRDEKFECTNVTDSDVIHANKKDLPCIFRIVSSCLWKTRRDSNESFTTYESSYYAPLLLLADSEQSKREWMDMILQTREMINICSIADNTVFRPTEAYDYNLPIIKSSLSSCVVDKERLALGTEDGLFVIELKKDEILKVGECKRVHQVEVLATEQLMVVLCGRNRNIRLYFLNSIEDGDSIKIDESKNCSMFAHGTFCQGTSSCIAVAIKKHVVIFEINKTKQRYKKIREISIQTSIQYLSIFNEQLCMGYTGGFSTFAIQGGKASKLVNSDDPTLSFVQQVNSDAMCMMPVNKQKEFLLCFNTCGIYVFPDGRRSRNLEVMWPAQPQHIVSNGSNLIVYSENFITIFDPEEVVWVQTINLKRVRPLSKTGSISFATHFDPHRLVYMARKNSKEANEEIFMSNTSSVGQRQMMRKSKKRHQFKVPSREHLSTLRNVLATNPERKSELISAPRDFVHKAHLGPDDMGMGSAHLLSLQGMQTADVRKHHDEFTSSNDFSSRLHQSEDTTAVTSMTSTLSAELNRRKLNDSAPDPVSGTMDNLSYDSRSSSSIGSSNENSVLRNRTTSDDFSIKWDM